MFRVMSVQIRFGGSKGSMSGAEAKMQQFVGEKDAHKILWEHLRKLGLIEQVQQIAARIDPAACRRGWTLARSTPA